MTRFTQLLEKLKEPSTIKGLVMVAALIGVNVDPELQNKILGGAAAVYALMQIFIVKEK